MSKPLEFIHSKSIIWMIVSVLAGCAAAIYAAYGRQPIEIRTVAVSIRYSFVTASLAVLLLTFLVFHIPGKWHIPAVFVIAGAVIGLTLGGLWASGQSEPYVVSGLIPYNDAATYMIDGNRLLDGERLSGMASKRPFSPGMLGAILAFTGRNLQHATAVFTVILAISCAFLLFEVNRGRGAVAAAVTFWIIVLFARRFTGTTMTEPLGLALGSLSLGLLIQGAFRKKFSTVLGGIFILSVSMNIRAGAFFVLPLLAAWVGFVFRDDRKFAWTKAGLALASIALAFILNSLLLRLIGVSESMLFGNFSESLYGLAAGGERWAEVYNRYPDLRLMNQSDKYTEIYRLSFELIKANPMDLVQGMFHQWGLLFSQTWFSVFSYVGGEDIAGNTPVHWFLYVLSLAALIQAAKKWREPLNSLLLVCIAGIFLSVPFVPPGDAHKMRAFAATIPMLAYLPALGAGWLTGFLPIPFFNEKKDYPVNEGAISVFTGLLVAFMVVAPPLTRLISKPPVVQPFACLPGEIPVTMHYAPGNEVRLIREDVLQLDWLPEFHFGRYKTFIHNLPNQESIEVLSQVEPPATLLLGYDIPSDERVWLLARTEQMPDHYGMLQICGNYLDTQDPDLLRYGFYYPREINLLR
jgi:hypothetical protein